MSDPSVSLVLPNRNNGRVLGHVLERLAENTTYPDTKRIAIDDGFHRGGSAITKPIGRRTYHERVIRAREEDCPQCETIAEVDGGAGCCRLADHYAYWRPNPDMRLAAERILAAFGELAPT